MRAGRWARDGAFPYARDVSGLQVGILGLGRIGSAIATRLLGFDCAIAYHNRHRIDGSPYRYAESPRGAGRVGRRPRRGHHGRRQRPAIWSTATVLEALGPEGYLINIARGSVVDQDALVELLPAGDWPERGWTSSSMNPTCPRELLDLDNVR